MNENAARPLPLSLGDGAACSGALKDPAHMGRDFSKGLSRGTKARVREQHSTLSLGGGRGGWVGWGICLQS